MTAPIQTPKKLLLAVLLASACALCNVAPSQTLSSTGVKRGYALVHQLQQNGQLTQAIEEADKYIAQNPTDPQMRFFKAVILEKAGSISQAQSVLLELTRDYPELAEPWNNLAVIYAAQGNLDQAHLALEAALRVDPSYATALENMADIEIQTAVRHYQKAVQSNGAVQRLKSKIGAAELVLKGGLSALPAASKSDSSTSKDPGAGPDGQNSDKSGNATKASTPSSSTPSSTKTQTDPVEIDSRDPTGSISHKSR